LIHGGKRRGGGVAMRKRMSPGKELGKKKRELGDGNEEEPYNRGGRQWKQERKAPEVRGIRKGTKGLNQTGDSRRQGDGSENMARTLSGINEKNLGR